LPVLDDTQLLEFGCQALAYVHGSDSLLFSQRWWWWNGLHGGQARRSVNHWSIGHVCLSIGSECHCGWGRQHDIQRWDDEGGAEARELSVGAVYMAVGAVLVGSS
jgi:hypothetical protein